jgi:hypothetical protein
MGELEPQLSHRSVIDAHTTGKKNPGDLSATGVFDTQRLHVVDHFLTKLRTRDQRGVIHQPLEVIGDLT